MPRLNLTAIHRSAAKNLEDSLRHYEEAPKGLAREFVELKLQGCIFQYDVCAEMVSFVRNKPTGFAAAVALKGLVLRLYEYDSLLNSNLIPRLLALTEARSVPFNRSTVMAPLPSRSWAWPSRQSRQPTVAKPPCALLSKLTSSGRLAAMWTTF